MNENPYGIRVALPTDAGVLFDFVLPMLNECALQPLSLEKARRLVERCVYRDRAFAGVLVGADGVQASVGATIDTADLTDQPHLMIRWLGVAPAFRNSDLAARLLGFVRWTHEAMGAERVPVLLPALNTTDQQRKLASYGRRAPLVSVVFGLGCLPDRHFVKPQRAARSEDRGRGSAPVDEPKPGRKA